MVKIAKEDLVEQYSKQGLVKCAKYFHVDVNIINYYLSLYEIPKRNKKDAYLLGGHLRRKETINKFKTVLTKDILEKEYSVTNIDILAKKYHTSSTIIKDLLKEYEIKERSGKDKYFLGSKKNHDRDINEFISSIDKDTFIQEYIDHGCTYICNKYHICNKKANNAVELLGVNNHLDFIDRLKLKIPKEEIEDYYNQYGICATALKYDVCVNTVGKLLKDYNIETCYKGEPNKYFASLLSSKRISYEREFYIKDNNDKRYFFDFKVDNILIDINPTETHNTIWSPFSNNIKDVNYHRDKMLCARKNGYRVINVWDWDDKEKVVALLENREKIYARNCSIKEITNKEAKEFLEMYHLQGYVKASINIGLFYNDELVLLMTFGKPRYTKKYEYELLRYCSSKEVIGGAQKLFTYFLKTYSAHSIISYCDESKFSGDIYNKLGFKKESEPRPSCHWYNITIKKHITDNLLRQKGFDQLFNTHYGKGTSNNDLMLEHGFLPVYDCGQATYILKI